MRCFVGTVVLLFLHVYLFCQTATVDQEQMFSEDSIYFQVQSSPVFVYATKLPTPFARTGISVEKISALNEPIIAPLLNATPGIWMQSGSLNTNRISIRGVGYREPFATTGIKMYLDEIPLTNGAGESSIEDIHPWLFEGIDVWRGPASAIWGSGLGGMINFQSKKINADTFSTRIQAGSYGRLQFDQQASFTYGANQQWGTLLHYEFLNDGGYRDNNHYTKHSATWSQQWESENGWQLGSFVHGIHLKAFIPSSINLADYENNPTTAAPTWDAVNGREDYSKWITGLNLSHTSSKGWVYKGALFANLFNSDEVRPFNVLDESNVSYGMRHRLALPIFTDAHITVGMEYYQEEYSFSTYETLEGGEAGEQLSDGKEGRSYINGFLQADWMPSSRWYLFAGGTLAYTDITNEEINSKIPLAGFPTVGMTYRWKPSIAFSGSVSRGYSALSLDDMLNADGTLNDEIVPETGWSGEVSILAGTMQNSYVKFSLFRMGIHNTVITRRIMDDIFEKINAGSSIHQGVELEYQWMPSNKLWSIQGAYTYGDFTFDEFTELDQDYSGNRLPGNPLHRTFNSLHFYPLTGLDLYIEHHWISEVYLNDANTITAEGYQLINPGIRYKFNWQKKWDLTISGYVHNVLDEHYSSMYQINAPGTTPRYYYRGKPRSFYVSFIVNL